MDAITSFSYKPLRLSFVLAGLAVLCLCLLAVCAWSPRGPANPIAFGITAGGVSRGQFCTLVRGHSGRISWAGVRRGQAAAAVDHLPGLRG